MPEDVQVSDPPPAPMMTSGITPPPLPGRADFPGAQPPPGAWQTYNEPVPTSSQGGMNPKAIKEAEAAVQAALRFQGMRGFQQDVQSGLAPDQAILKHGPKMFVGNPGAFVSAMHRLAPPPASETGPAQTVPAVDANGIPVPGVHILRSPHGYHVIHDPASTENKQAAEGRKFRLGQIKEDLKAAKSALAGMPAASPKRAAAQKEVTRLEAAAEQLLGGSNATKAVAAAGAGAGVMVKNKKTGQKFTYRGSREDVPADEFEIVQ